MRTGATLLLVLALFPASVVLAQSQPGLPVPGLHSAAAGDCGVLPCQQGEWAATVEEMVPPGLYTYVEDPDCMTDLQVDREKLGMALEAAGYPGLEDVAGPFADIVAAPVGQWLNRNIQGAVGEILSKYEGPTAQCQLLCVKITKGSQLTGVALRVGDGGYGVGKCDLNEATGEAPCSVGWSKWVDVPSRTVKKDVVCGVFMNWSHDRQRAASFTAFFVPPPGAKAPVPSR